MQTQRGEGFDLRIRRHACFIAVAAKLPAYHLLGIQRSHGAEQAQLLGTHRIRIAADRRVHCQQCDHLQQMVLHHVADRANLLVEAAASLDAKILRHCDLDAVDEIAIPYRLEERVGKAEVKQVLHRLLSQIVVDAEHRGFRKHFVQRPVELLCRGQVAAEGLFDDDSRVLRTPRLRQTLHHGREHAGRDGEIVQRTRRPVECLPQTLVRRRILVVAADVLQPRRQFHKRVGIDSAIVLEAVARPLAQLVQRPAGAGHAYDRHIQLAGSDQRLQRGKDLLIGQIAGCTEENEGVRFGH